MAVVHGKDGWLDTTNTKQRRILDLRTVGMRSTLTFGRFHYNCAAAQLEEMRHESWLVLLFVLKGCQHYRIDGREVEVRGGQILRILPGQRYSTGDWPEQRGDTVWLILKTHPLPRGRAMGMEEKGVRSVFERLTDPSLPAVFPQPAGMAESAEAVFQAWDLDDEPLRSELVRNRVASLVLNSAVALCAPPQPSSPARERIGRALRRIGELLDDPPSIEDLAAQARLSTSRFYDEFKLVTGTTPHDYMVRTRVGEAGRRLLANPELSVTRVAYDLGFSSSQYFSTVFRRYLGCSPSTWRNGRNPG